MRRQNGTDTVSFVSTVVDEINPSYFDIRNTLPPITRAKNVPPDEGT